jgi:stage V sporulation protein S
LNGVEWTGNRAEAPDRKKGMIEVLKVSSRSNPNAVAGALAGVVRSAGVVEIQVVGAGALNQAVKAVAIARGYLSPSGVDLICVPTFVDIHIGGERRTAIRVLCENRLVAGPMLDLRAAETDRAQAAVAPSQATHAPPPAQ